MQAVWQHAKQSGGALVLLLAIADNAHDDGDSAYPSIGTLAKKARMTERNVNILLKQLTLAGEISIRHGEGPRGTNVYRVNLHEEPTPENISPPKTFHPEKSDKGGEVGFRGGVKPTSPKPSVNRQREPSPTVRAVPKPRTLRADQEPGFERWYANYPNRQHRPDAEKAWRKLDPDGDLFDTLMADVPERKRGRKWADGFVELPATYLNNRVWEDDIEPYRLARPTQADHNSARRGKLVT